MEFRDLKKQYQTLKPQLDEAIGKVLTDCNFISGKQVEELEKSLTQYVDVPYCVTCGNGTDALTMALKVWGVQAGDAVFVPDFTFFASAETIAFEGATPIFVDVEEDTFNIDPAKLEEAIERILQEKTFTPKGIVAVDLFGLPADYAKLEKIAKKYNLFLLEDGAQGFGGTFQGRKVGSFGDLATTSFFPAKPLGCYGDGGAIFSHSLDTTEFLRSLRVHGKGSYKYDNVRIGWNSRLDTLQAAILQVKLKAFEEYELQAVNHVAKLYTERLDKLVKTPIVPEGYTSSWAQYTITLENREQRDSLQQALKEQGIPTMIYYPIPLHKQKAFAGLTGQLDDFPVTEKLCDCVLSLPMHPYLQIDEIDIVCSAIQKFLK